MSSLSSYFVKILARITRIKKICNLNDEELRKYSSRKYGKQKSSPNKFIYKNYNVEEIYIDSHLCYVVASKTLVNNKSVIMLHGGAYIIEIGIVNWRAVAKLIDRLNVKVYVPIYPLAPEFTYRNTIDLMENLYIEILKVVNAKDITIIGDSAGAQIALSFCQYLKILGLPQPKDIILLSPPLDNNPPQCEVEKMISLQRSDYLVTSNLFTTALKWWSEGTQRNNYLVSPIYGDFIGLGKVSIFYSTNEILSIQINKLKKQAKMLEFDIDFYEGKGMIHCWPYLPFKEGNIAFNQIVKIIKGDEGKQ
ncbi:MAG: alpha/beta hydrolase fold domain-containing protein [Clostridiaceae bacterium]